MEDRWSVGERTLTSRLLVGTGKFRSHEVMRDAVLASGAEVVTVALRRVDLDRVASNGGGGDVLDFVPPGMTCCRTPRAPSTPTRRSAWRGSAARRTGADLVKLEVTPDPRTLAPDPIETLRAAERLVAEGFVVLPYCSRRPGAVPPPRGGRLRDRHAARGLDRQQPRAAHPRRDRGHRRAGRRAGRRRRRPRRPQRRRRGDGVGADAVLVNTAIAVAADPVLMARAFALATEAGRLGRLAGRGAVRETAEASSPLTGFLT